MSINTQTPAENDPDYFKKWILPAGEYRSRSEYFFAQWCNKWRIPFTYEPECFRLPGGEFYPGGIKFLPDFFLCESNIFVEIKPAIFRGELWKFERFLETIPSRHKLSVAKDGDPIWNAERDDLALGWVVEIRKQEPVAVALYDDCGMTDWQGYDSDTHANGFHTCRCCGRPFILATGDWSCQHCKYYASNSTADWGVEYHSERLAKSISQCTANWKAERAAAYESAARVEAEAARVKAEKEKTRREQLLLFEKAAQGQSNRERFANGLKFFNYTPQEFVALALDEGWTHLDAGGFEKIPDTRFVVCMEPENLSLILELLAEKTAMPF